MPMAGPLDEVEGRALGTLRRFISSSGSFAEAFRNCSKALYLDVFLTYLIT